VLGEPQVAFPLVDRGRKLKPDVILFVGPHSPSHRSELNPYQGPAVFAFPEFTARRSVSDAIVVTDIRNGGKDGDITRQDAVSAVTPCLCLVPLPGDPIGFTRNHSTGVQ
jgi:hypothetical protein